jgi:hypothetical protein
MPEETFILSGCDSKAGRIETSLEQYFNAYPGMGCDASWASTT